MPSGQPADGIEKATPFLRWGGTWTPFLALLPPYVLLVWREWFVCDDAFITFRYARNWAEGYGPTYNLDGSPPVEGYSNFLWMAIAAVFECVGADVTLVMPLLSFACGVLLLLLVYDAMGRLGLSLVGRVSGAALLAFSPPYVTWTTGGLETMAEALLLFATFDLLALRGERSVWLAVGTALMLSLVRTEGIAWVGVCVVAALTVRFLAKRPLWPVLAVLGLTLIGWLPYFAWKTSYYGSMLSQTARTKVAFSVASVFRGAGYVYSFGLSFVTPALVPLGVVVGFARNRGPEASGLAVMALAVPAHAVAVSGDFMAMFRLLVPALAFFAILIAVAIDGLAVFLERKGLTGWPALGAGALGVAVAVLPLFGVYAVPERMRMMFDWMPGELSTDLMTARSERWSRTGKALRTVTKPGDSLVIGHIGAIGYYSDLTIYDQFGLVTPEVAESRAGRVGVPGHDKHVPVSFFRDRDPTLLYADVVDSRAGALMAMHRIGTLGWARGKYVPEVIVLDEGWLVIYRKIRWKEQPSRAWRTTRERMLEMPLRPMLKTGEERDTGG